MLCDEHKRFVTCSFQEYDNEAESLVSSLSLNYDDEDIDIGRCVYYNDCGQVPIDRNKITFLKPQV